MQVQPVTPYLVARASDIDEPGGLVVTRVEPQSPAADGRACSVGDIIRSVNGEPVNTAEDAQRGIFGARRRRHARLDDRARRAGRSDVHAHPRRGTAGRSTDDRALYAPRDGRASGATRAGFARWLDVELAALAAREARGDVPAGHGRGASARRARLDAGAHRLRSRPTLQHDVIAFLTDVGGVARRRRSATCTPGMTSSDLVDTALALPDPARRAALLARGRRSPAPAARARPGRAPPAHADGRAHARRARRADHLRAQGAAVVRRSSARARAALLDGGAARDCAVGKLSGAVGTLAHLDADGRGGRAAPRSGSRPSRWRPRSCSATATPRCSRALAVPGGTLRADRAPRSATCSAPRCARLEEPFGARAEGLARRCRTSATRCVCERISRAGAPAARLRASPASRTVALWHERDISHSLGRAGHPARRVPARRLHARPARAG